MWVRRKDDCWFPAGRFWSKETVRWHFFTSDFLTDGLLPRTLLSIKRLFKFGFEFDEIFAIFDWLSAIIYSGESILPVLFTTESCDSPYHFSGETLFVRIICINSRMSFNTESRYSPYCLLQRVATPRLIYSGESLLTAESYFQKLWRTSPSFKGTIKQTMDYPYRVLLTKNIWKE
jgi:hypothetical protein